MTRHAPMVPRLDAVHAVLREHPGLSADEVARLLPRKPCGCARSDWPWPRAAACPACQGAQEVRQQRADAYALLRKLEDDGRARRDKAGQGQTHTWWAIGDAPEPADELDDHWDWLASQAPVSSELALEEAVREHARLAHLLADKDRTRATTQRELDELICGLCDGRMQKDVAALLGIRPHDVRAARDRLWRQRSAGRP